MNKKRLQMQKRNIPRDITDYRRWKNVVKLAQMTGLTIGQASAYIRAFEAAGR